MNKNAWDTKRCFDVAVYPEISVGENHGVVKQQDNASYHPVHSVKT